MLTPPGALDTKTSDTDIPAYTHVRTPLHTRINTSDAHIHSESIQLHHAHISVFCGNAENARNLKGVGQTGDQIVCFSQVAAQTDGDLR